MFFETEVVAVPFRFMSIFEVLLHTSYVFTKYVIFAVFWVYCKMLDGLLLNHYMGTSLEDEFRGTECMIQNRWVWWLFQKSLREGQD